MRFQLLWLMEKLIGHARAISPWGYHLEPEFA